MTLTLDRKYKLPTYTIGKLYIDGEYFCDTLEDKDRGLTDDMTVSEISKIKIKNETAIPTGTYSITLNIVSPRFSVSSFYKQVCNGKLPRLLNVKGFDGILIHAGNTDKDSAGCLLVGMNLERGKVLKSQETFRKLYKMLSGAKLRGESIQITIK